MRFWRLSPVGKIAQAGDAVVEVESDFPKKNFPSGGPAGLYRAPCTYNLRVASSHAYSGQPAPSQYRIPLRSDPSNALGRTPNSPVWIRPEGWGERSPPPPDPQPDLVNLPGH